MVDQPQSAISVDLGEQGKLGIGGTALQPGRRRNCCRPRRTIEAPMQDDPITECGCRPSGLSSCSSR